MKQWDETIDQSEHRVKAKEQVIGRLNPARSEKA